MQTALAIILALSLITVVVSVVFGIFIRGKRLRGWYAAAASIFLAIVSGLGIGALADSDARSEGFLDYLDKISAQGEGYDDPSDWALVRDKFKEQALAARAEQVAASNEPSREEKCRADLACWGDKYAIWAGYECPVEIEKLATYRANWLDGWLEGKFTHYRWLSEESGTVTMIGDSLEFENGFGAGTNMIYECDIDPDAKTVLAVRAFEGRL
jgi:hypothetical protein